MQSNGCASQEITASARRFGNPCQLVVEMEMTDKNSLAIAEYKRLVSEQYQEPYLPYHRVYCSKRKVSR